MAVTHAIGRRKTSVARVYVQEGKGDIVINNKSLSDYFPSAIMQFKVEQPFEILEQKGNFDVKVNVEGGGLTGQAEAIRLGISRAMVLLNPDHRATLKPDGLMTRDPRMVERKKFGQKKARKKFQFSKR
jgi:small subunit ribosomal protein S9